MNRTIAFAGLVVLIASFGACGQIDPIDGPPLDTGSADFTRLVALGNSLTAGVQGLGVVESHQRRAYPALIAGRLGKPVYTGLEEIPDNNADDIPDADPEAFVLPGWSAPGSPGTLLLVRIDPVTIEPVLPFEAGSPVNLGYPGIYNSIAVPGATVNDMIHELGGSPTSPFTPVLRNQGTMLQLAVALQPTFVLLWAGSNDVFGAVSRGSTVGLTSAFDFERDLRIVMAGFLGSPRSGRATRGLQGGPPNPGMACANIPDVTSLPFVTTIPPAVPGPGGTLISLLGPNGFLGEGDFVTLPAQELIAAGFGFSVGTDLNGDGIPDGQGPLPDAVVLSKSEITVIQNRIDAYNTIITEVAAAYGVPVADVNTAFADIGTNGISVGGVEYDARFILGGVFSLDGIHPTDIGQAIIANLFIEAINDAYGASIPMVNLSKVMGLNFGVGSVVQPEALLDPESSARVRFGDGWQDAVFGGGN